MHIPHVTTNEQLAGGSVLSPSENLELVSPAVPMQPLGEHDAIRPMDEAREEALQQLGDTVLAYILDGNVRTVTRDHLLHTAVNFGGALTTQEERFFMNNTGVSVRLEPIDRHGDLFSPKPGRQRKPVDVSPAKKLFKDLRGKYRKLF